MMRCIMDSLAPEAVDGLQGVKMTKLKAHWFRDGSAMLTVMRNGLGDAEGERRGAVRSRFERLTFRHGHSVGKAPRECDWFAGGMEAPDDP
jgi:hypothetical protein